MNQLIIGTCNFVNIISAIRYYRNQNGCELSLKNAHTLIQNKIHAKEIAIGIPAHKPNEMVISDSDGRYHIKTITQK